MHSSLMATSSPVEMLVPKNDKKARGPVTRSPDKTKFIGEKKVGKKHIRVHGGVGAFMRVVGQICNQLP